MIRIDSEYDIVIVGSGIVGATAALALAKNTSLNIAVLEAKSFSFNELWHSRETETRVSAIALSSQRIFENINAWESIVSKRISPYTDMHVWDPRGKGELFFSAKTLQIDALGFIIEDEVIKNSLLAQFKQYDHLEFLCPVTLLSLEKKSDGILLTTADQQIIQTKLLIAADGAESWVRQQLEVELATHDYQHTAIIATVQTELPHQAIARQSFLATGPLAFLPLENAKQCSIVWSVPPDYAAELLTLNDDAFNKLLSSTFEYRLGHVVTITPRQSFPLKMRHAKHYVGERYALIGDAAHTLHPLAGQGVNLGLLDAVTLADVVFNACKKNRDFASYHTLRRYERWRKGDTLTMLKAVEALKYVFSENNKPLFYLRNAGLSTLNQLSFIKSFIAHYAIGKRIDLPEIAM